MQVSHCLWGSAMAGVCMGCPLKLTETLLLEPTVYEVADISLELLPFSYTIEITPSWNKRANIERYP